MQVFIIGMATGGTYTGVHMDLDLDPAGLKKMVSDPDPTDSVPKRVQNGSSISYANDVHFHIKIKFESITH